MFWISLRLCPAGDQATKKELAITLKGISKAETTDTTYYLPLRLKDGIICFAGKLLFDSTGKLYYDTVSLGFEKIKKIHYEFWDQQQSRFRALLIYTNIIGVSLVGGIVTTLVNDNLPLALLFGGLLAVDLGLEGYLLNKPDKVCNIEPSEWQFSK